MTDRYIPNKPRIDKLNGQCYICGKVHDGPCLKNEDMPGALPKFSLHDILLSYPQVDSTPPDAATLKEAEVRQYCFYCKKDGHRISECPDLTLPRLSEPSLSQQLSELLAQARKAADLSSDKAVCTRCGVGYYLESGHTCSEAPSSRFDRLIQSLSCKGCGRVNCICKTSESKQPPTL